MRRRFKTNDDAVPVMWCQVKKQQIEAIKVIPPQKSQRRSD